MTSTTNVGILGIGVYLPDEVRTNDWWPESLVNQWRQKNAEILPSDKKPPEPRTEGERLSLAAMAEARRDPFYGAVERRVKPAGMFASDMETLAGKDALDKAGVKKSEVGLLLTYSATPDYLTAPNACAVQNKMGLSSKCLSVSIEAECNSFLSQLWLAEGMIRAGQVGHALLVQSNSTELLDPQHPCSAWFGEGATAVVVGPVRSERGILGRSYYVDGSLHDAVVSTVPGRRWFDEGRISWHSHDKQRSPLLILQAADFARKMVGEALESAHMTLDDVDFYAAHQATVWFGPLTREYVGLSQARSVDTFKWAGHMNTCNIPLVLATAEKEGLLRPGDVVAGFAGGLGFTASSIIMRWGR